MIPCLISLGSQDQKPQRLTASLSLHLTVSQFTLLASTKKGTKPDFHGAANPEEAKRLYDYFVQKVKAVYMDDRVKDGRFQAMMEVALVNDGPVSYFALDDIPALKGED